MAHVKLAEAIAVATCGTELDSSVNAVGTNIPCENPHSTAPAASIGKLDGKATRITAPAAKLNLLFSNPFEMLATLNPNFGPK